MTREEAIARIEEHKIIHKMNEPRAIYISEALDMAIKALEQETCEDAISRQALLDTISELNAISFYEAQEDSKECYYEIRQAIKDLLPVKPQEKTGHWVEEIINIGSRKVFCSECGCSAPFEYVSNGDVYSASAYGVINKTSFCPNCGKRMIEPKKSEVNK